MVKKVSMVYVCQSCGAQFPKWNGKCDACGGWNTLAEEAPRGLAGGAGGARRASGSAIQWKGLAGAEKPRERLVSGIAELDRATGGGMVPGSVILIGGDPGIGKSTLLLQLTAALAGRHVCAYVSGEEAVDQVRLRARRLGLAGTAVRLASTTSADEVLASLDPGLDVLVIDSIQTMETAALDGAPGTVGQVRACAHELTKAAKSLNFVLFLVGHMTKEGALAGPKVLEHMVDTVLYFEGDRGHQFRILRAVKNRFGATDEIGVFEMTEGGLAEVSNPSALFLAERRGNVSGSCVFAGIEGSRPLLVEIQALVSPSASGGASPPRRAVVGWDSARLSMVLAVLEARCGLRFSSKDIFLNVAGGLKISEPAMDLAAATALISAATGRPAPADCVYFGEIGLSGEVRSAPQTDLRLKEAIKLGFGSACVPPRRGDKKTVARGAEIALQEIGNVQTLTGLFTNG
ncbi:DNA repair protein RadA [Alphaproteobacteria bacterium]|nr:DNA repair protein RadA [Alphaproteobacteria bacterium]